MDPIPDHSIFNPFTGSQLKLKQHARFEKHRELIVTQFKKIYDVGRLSHHAWTCEMCGARMGCSTQTGILQHLATIKHLKACGIVLDD